MYPRANDLKKIDQVGKEVSLRGWVYRLRRQKERTFIIIRDDRGGVIQSVFPTQSASHLTLESSVEISGILQRDSRAPEGGYEIKGIDLKIFHRAENDFPIGEYQSIELLLNKRHLALRTRRMISMAKIRSSIIRLAREWLVTNDWLEITPPILVKGAVEGGSTLFKLKYFGEDVYLSQSAQLYLEAMIFSLGPVWSLSSSFRAERFKTTRHLSEFSHLEAEVPWVELEDVLAIQEQLISYIVQNIIKENTEDLFFLKQNIETLKKIEAPFDRLTYKRAIEILQAKEFNITEENGKKRRIRFGDDLNIDSERELTRVSVKPVFVTGYPMEVKPFYVKRDPQNNGTGLSADMLAPQGFGEITSGGIREDDISSLRKRMVGEGLQADQYEWYLDTRRYGSIPHGGFGLGIERLIRWITNTEDIKDTVLFPRTMSRITP
jgi:asparaginyl-tRNA synthetase